METYSFLRQFADSWALAVLMLFFIGMIVWVFRPGSTPQHRDSAEIPFRHESKPADDDDTAHRATFKEARP